MYPFIKRIILFFSFFIYLNAVFTQIETHSVFLIGNSADVPDEELLSYSKALHDLLEVQEEDFSVVYTGDLSNQLTYDQNALTYDSIRISILLTASQFPNSRQILIPGDRDWLNSGEDGWKYFKSLERIIEKRFKHVNWIPGKGCPGPKVVKLSDHVLLIGLDTQYWNHPYERPGPTEAICKISRDGDFLEELEDVIDEAGNTNILIAGHFPLISNGPYGGKNSLKRHLFPLTDQQPSLFVPLPLFGSLYAAYRQNVGNKLDIINKNYNDMREHLLDVVHENKNLIYASGHEKNLQVLKEGNSFLINSGAAFETSFIRKDPRSKYLSKKPGLLKLSYYADGRVHSQAYELTNGQFRPSNPLVLFNSPCIDTIKVEEINHAFIPCKAISTQAQSQLPTEALAKAKGGKEYEAKGVKKLLLGDLYRKTWTQSIQVPYLSIAKTHGGLKILERGGGVQTQSLKFAAQDGNEYVFRSINKNPVKALPLEFRTRFFSSLARQSTATQHPYGAIAVDELLNYTDILHAHPRLYLMPNDSRLGNFQEEFGGMLGMLEERPMKAKKNRPASFEAHDVIRSYQLFRKLYDDHDNRVDKYSFLESRIFDIWIGDRGRHEENFKWAEFKTSEGKIFKPIPRDRDHAFSVLDGVIPWLIDRPWALPFFEDFDFKVKDLKSLNYSGRHLDRLLLTELSKEEWLRFSEKIRNTFDDEKIRTSLQAMPPETWEISGKEIFEKLKARRDQLDLYAEGYYKILAREVDIVGSNKREYFEVSRMSDGSVRVDMYNVSSFEKNIRGEKRLFSRTFFPNETKEIRIYGLGGKDIIHISGKASKSIKIRALGGDGEDKIYDLSDVKGNKKWTLIYEKNRRSTFDLGTEARRMSPKNEKIYDYRRKAFVYDSYLPIPTLSYSNAEGFKAGWGYQFTNRAFGKEDYAVQQSFQVYGSTQNNFGLKYAIRLRQFIREWDFVGKAEWARPDRYNNFFGLGNETVFVDSLYRQNFYRSRNQTLNLGLGLERVFWNNSSFNIAFRFEKNDRQALSNNIFELDPYQNIPGTLDLDKYQVNVSLDLNFTDNRILPERGMRLFLYHKNGFIKREEFTNYGLSEAFVLWYGSTRSLKHPLTLGLRFGAGDSYGIIPFYDKFVLGQRENLHGFRRRRFTGDAKAYLNSELRLQVGKFRAFIPITYGISGFYDRGRVFLDGENSNKWHEGYGFGFYMVPASRSLSFQLSLGFSEESQGILLFTLGSLIR